MGCYDLVCASCAGRVVDGRCGTCRAARAELCPPTHLAAVALQAAFVGLAAVVALLLVVLALGLG